MALRPAQSVIQVRDKLTTRPPRGNGRSASNWTSCSLQRSEPVYRAFGPQLPKSRRPRSGQHPVYGWCHFIGSGEGGWGSHPASVWELAKAVSASTTRDAFTSSAASQISETV